MPLSDQDANAVCAMRAPVAIIDYAGGDAHAVSRAIPVETPVGIEYANLPFAVMMMTPYDLEDFAVGFTVTEGIARSREDIRSVHVAPDAAGLRMRIDLAPNSLHAHLARRRAMSGRTGCGVCGIDDFDALPRARVRLRETSNAVAVDSVQRALDALSDHQKLNQVTRAVHAAAWADTVGTIQLVREDVGRHNALDKLIGALLRAEYDPAAGFIVVTSRCSFEMVEKAAAFGASTLVAISAPTSLALERARLHDMTMIALARQDNFMVFHGRERVIEKVEAYA